jgi:hypothetical protein
VTLVESPLAASLWPRCLARTRAHGIAAARQHPFVLATIRSERSFVDATDTSRKCHNFLSISSQATVRGVDHHIGVTPALRHCHESAGISI